MISVNDLAIRVGLLDVNRGNPITVVFQNFRKIAIATTDIQSRFPLAVAINQAQGDFLALGGMTKIALAEIQWDFFQ